GAKRLCAMVWHYHDDDVPGPAADVTVSLAGLPDGVREGRVQHFRIDEHHSNAFTAWRAMGSPQRPTPEQYAQLERAGHLDALQPTETVRVDGGRRRCGSRSRGR